MTVPTTQQASCLCSSAPTVNVRRGKNTDNQSSIPPKIWEYMGSEGEDENPEKIGTYRETCHWCVFICVSQGPFTIVELSESEPTITGSAVVDAGRRGRTHTRDTPSVFGIFREVMLAQRLLIAAIGLRPISPPCLGSASDASWMHLGISWGASRGPDESNLIATLGLPGRLSGPLLGASSGLLGVSREPLGVMLKVFGAVLEEQATNAPSSSLYWFPVGTLLGLPCAVLRASRTVMGLA
eukprot:6215631-Pyramimonas_sp.AAC.1